MRIAAQAASKAKSQLHAKQDQKNKDKRKLSTNCHTTTMSCGCGNKNISLYNRQLLQRKCRHQPFPFITDFATLAFCYSAFGICCCNCCCYFLVHMLLVPINICSLSIGCFLFVLSSFDDATTALKFYRIAICHSQTFYVFLSCVCVCD